MKKFLSNAIKVLLPLLISAVVLAYTYRDYDFSKEAWITNEKVSNKILSKKFREKLFKSFSLFSFCRSLDFCDIRHDDRDG